ncbi:MAG: ATP-dependent helicase [Muribaculaceae bacterium]|nr:ATP-dependent helicase [Muribaculaceae bacterium]
MEYEITDQRREYLNARGFTILTACPGSGKTTSIVYKLKTLIEECRINNSNGTGVLCMSFTNKACEEISSKYKEMHGRSIDYPNEVRTIDSFITQYVVLRYWYLIEGLSKPIIINEDEILHNLFFHKYNGGEYLPYALREYNDLAHSYKPEKVEYIGHNLFKIENTIVSKDNDIRLFNYCNAILHYRLTHGALKSSDAMLVASNILKKHFVVAQSLANRFPYVILDEAQDTSYHQFEILELLKDAGLSNLELVGDVNQSVYEWRNARPEIFQQYNEKEEWNHLILMENRRSVQRIIDFYSRLKPIGYPNIVSYGVDDANIQIEIIRYNNGQERMAFDRFSEICEGYNLKSRLVLVRGKTDLTKLAAFRTSIKPWKSEIPYRIIDAELLFAQNKIKEALEKMGWICAYLIYGDDHFSEMKNYLKERGNTIEFNIMLLKLLKSMPPLSLSFNRWDESIRLLLRNGLNITEDLDFKFKQRMKGYNNMNRLRNQSVDTYFGQVEENVVTAQTIHSAKGASVDAVLLYLHDRSGAQVISFNDLPDNSNGLAEIKEKHRLIYVACSRAKQLLTIAIPSTITENQIRRKLNGLDFHISSRGVQMVLNL